jgi:hypothetical protein
MSFPAIAPPPARSPTLLRLLTILVALVALGAGGGCDLSSLFGRQPECSRSRDCDDDERCRRGRCVRADTVDPGEGEGEGEGEGDPEPDPDGPQFLQLSTNVTTVRDTTTVVFTALLTDPDGIDDIIGGSLVDPGTGSSYGAFQTSAAEGSYSMSVTWNEINTVAPIDFATTGTRGFRARFFDVAGHVAE